MSRRDLDFLLYEWLAVETLFARERYADHDRDTADALLDLAEELATGRFAGHNRAADLEEPTFDGTRVTVHPDVGPALAAFADAGFLAATLDEAVGGHQLPATVASACMAWFQAANAGTAGYALLTQAAANLLAAHGTPEQVEHWLRPMLEGRFHARWRSRSPTPARTSPTSPRGRNRRTTAATGSSARRCGSPAATTS